MENTSVNAATRDETKTWYETYARTMGDDRNDLLRNPGVLYQVMAPEIGIVRALYRTNLDRIDSKILDVGCGSGDSLATFFRLGFIPENIYGIDILQDRIREAEMRFPGVHFTAGDATQMPYEDGTFDLVLESTMFIHVVDEGLARSISQEMVRVTKPGGHILLIDWRFPKPGNPNYLAVTRKRIRERFGVGTQTQIVTSYPGALLPPLGRRLSKYAGWLYFPLQVFCPFLVGQRVTLLKKQA